MSKFGRPCWDVETCLSGWSAGGGIYQNPNVIFSQPSPFIGYQGNHGNTGGNGTGQTQSTTVTTQQVNTLLNATPKKENINTGISQIDLFTQIKTLVVENQLIALTGAALFIYLLAKKRA